MTSSEIPPKSKGLDEIVLWVAIALFLSLGIAWLVYPRIYAHSHPGLPWPIIPQRWVGYADSSPTLVYFFLACMTAGFGFWQTRFSRRFGRDSSRILLWLYLLASVVFVAGSWTFDAGSHFWTIPNQNELYEPNRVLEIGRILVKFGVYSTLAAAFLNVTYSSFRERRA
jgi:cytochrome bd-type quinol oxidase subunit 1